jgi:hypothetical protein
MNTYLSSIDFKIRSANYHLIKTLEALDGETKHPDILLAAGAEFIAMMSALHSCLDVLAQWINVEYRLNFKEHDVTFDRIVNKTNDLEIHQKLLDCQNETTYLDDFCNYNKHRNIVKVKRVWNFVTAYHPSVAYDIEEFKRKGRVHPPQTLKYQLHYQYGLVLNHLKVLTEYRFPLRNPD